MGLRVFSVAGDALNFGGRKMETIMRVAWLPVILLLIVNMATVFAYLSVVAGRSITFRDVVTWERAQSYLVQYWSNGWETSPNLMALISILSFIAQSLLIASFMAPLTRFAGLGEKPRPGVLRAPFGPDQIRYVLATLLSFAFVAVLAYGPVLATSLYALSYIGDAAAQTVATFPDPDSLHTIEVITLGETLAGRGQSWIYQFAAPAIAVAPFALVLWLILFLHFHPRNRPSAPDRGQPFIRAIVTLVGAALILGAVYWFAHELIVEQVQKSATLAQQTAKSLAGEQGAAAGEAAGAISKAPEPAVIIFGVVALALFAYFNLRFYAYPGIAVCRRSMGFGGLAVVSRGWNIFRLQAILIIVGLSLFAFQYIINNYVIGWILQTILILYQTIETSTRLVNSGNAAEWVQPFFVWLWSSIKILINIFWTFFSYGVTAGLYGRLYRESER